MNEDSQLIVVVIIGALLFLFLAYKFFRMLFTNRNSSKKRQPFSSCGDCNECNLKELIDKAHNSSQGSKAETKEKGINRE